MSFKTSLVDIDKINSQVKRSTFSEVELEKLAQLILQLNGIVQPLVVKEIGLEKYEVLEGDFQFYGALKAWEIDDNFEMVRAFIVNDKESTLVTKQLKLLQVPHISNSQPKSEDNLIVKQDKNLDIRIDNLEQRLNRYIETSEANLQNKVQELELKISQINEQLPTKLDVLTAFNEYPIEKLYSPIQTAGISDKDVSKILDFIGKERKKKAFDSLDDIVERSKVKQGKRKVRLITESKLLKIIDRWSKTAFY
jgi:hypothetical protein